MRRAFIDLETDDYQPASAMLPCFAYAQESCHRPVRRGGPPGDPPTLGRTARRADRAHGPAAPANSSGSMSRSCSSARSPNWPWIREAYTENTRRKRAETPRSRRATDVPGQTRDADLPARRTAVHRRPLRARPVPRAGGRREPLDRRREGTRARRRGPGTRPTSRSGPARSRRICSRPTSSISATSR